MSKICPNCGTNIEDESVQFCPSCGGSMQNAASSNTSGGSTSNNLEGTVVTGSPTPDSNEKKKFPVWAIALIAIGVILVLGLAALKIIENARLNALEEATNELDKINDQVNDAINDTITTKGLDKGTYKVGETFTVDDFEVTINSGYSIITYDNEYSDKNGTELIDIPVTLKNTSDDSKRFNPYYYSPYKPDGTAADYFDNIMYNDKTLKNSDKLLAGATEQVHAYIVYAGDGDYTLEFTDEFYFDYKVVVTVTK